MRKVVLGILSVIIILMCSIQIHAQEVDTLKSKPVYKHALGAAAGYTTGCGWSYKYSINKFSTQLVFLPVYESEYHMRFSSGLTFMYRLVETNYVNLFLYEGNHWHYSKPHWHNLYYEDDDIENYVNCGLGFGLEFLLGERLAFNLMFGYAARENFEKIKPTIETGLFYKF